MTVAGIISEYNPFHAGHARHIEKTRCACDFVVCAMAGAFTQRGEPAAFDKFARARMALEGGADAVFELPAVYVVRAAADFALGGVVTLGSLGVDLLSFGCETDDIGFISRIADISDDEPSEVRDGIRARLKEGKSFARARGEAISEYLGIDNDSLDRPNLSLAVEYVKCLKRLFPRVSPFAVKRGTEHRDKVLREFSSAAAIRLALLDGRADAALAALPESVQGMAASEAREGMSNPSALDDIALYKLRGMSVDEARTLPDAGEGLIERVLKLSRECASIEELTVRAKCKRYTRARISRLITQALLDMPQKAPAEPPYLRLLGFRESARPLITELNRRSNGSICADASRIAMNPCFMLETRATDLWGLTTQNPKYRVSGRDRTEKFITV